MPDPTIDAPGMSEIGGVLKTRYPSSPKRRRFQRVDLRKARGFGRTELRGRLPVTRSPRS